MANLSNINGKFVVEQTTGYVGVGTTDPAYLLHMSSADTTNGTRLIIENTNASGKEYGLITDNTGVFSLRDLTAGADRLTIDSSGNSTFSGGVNITGTNNTTSTLTLTNTAPTPDNSWSLVPQYNSQDLHLLEDTTTQVTFKSGGNVGIGTDAPSNRLTVNQGGGVRVTGIANGSYIELSGNLPGYAVDQYPVIKSDGTIHFANNGKYSAFIQGSDTYFGLLNSSTQAKVQLHTNGNTYFLGGSIGIGTTTPVVTAWGSTDTRQLTIVGSNYGVITLQGSATALTKYSMGVGGNRFYMAYDNVTGVHRMTIDSTGNVGIGTTAPDVKLSVEDGDGGGTAAGTDSRTKLLINASTEAYMSFNTPALSFNGHRLNIAGATKGSFELWDYAADPQVRIASIDARPLTFCTTNTERMRITSAGGISFGTTGTAYGTAGQILTSNGNTPPSWQTASNTGTVTSVAAGNGLAGGTITTTGALSTVHLPSFDTRSVNPDPEDYANLIRFDFKANGTNGLNDGGGYNGQMTWRSYGSGADLSGGQPIRLAYTANGNLWRQMGTSATTWGSWAKFSMTESPWTTSGSNISFTGGTVGIITSGSNPAELYFNNTANNFGNNFSILYQQSGGSNYNYEPLLTLKHKNSSFWFFGTSSSSTPKTVIQHQQGSGMPSSNNMDKGMLQLAGEQYGGNYPPLTMQKGTNGNSSGYMAGFKETSGSGYGYIMKFFNNGNNTVGSVRYNSGQSGVSFNTSSDYRLKEDLQDFKGLEMVLKIPVYDFKWKLQENRSYGVLAHELQEVLPQAVAEKKDSEHMQGVDYSKIVPLLIKSIQELKAEIEILKNK